MPLKFGLPSAVAGGVRCRRSCDCHPRMAPAVIAAATAMTTTSVERVSHGYFPCPRPLFTGFTIDRSAAPSPSMRLFA